MRSLFALSLTAAVLVAPTTASAATRACPQSDPANGLRALRAANITCPKAFAVARQTNSVKCFLNGNSCTHTFRGRRWRCVLRDGERVRCASGRKVVKYRLG